MISEAKCPYLPIKTPLKVIGIPRGRAVGAILQFECDEGYELEGVSTIRCVLENDQVKWSANALPDCKRISALFDCDMELPSGVISNSDGLKVGESAMFKCLQPNYFLTRKSYYSNFILFLSL